MITLLEGAVDYVNCAYHYVIFDFHFGYFPSGFSGQDLGSDCYIS